MRGQAHAALAAVLAAAVFPKVLLAGADAPSCPYFVGSEDRAKPYRCMEHCPSRHYSKLLNWPQQGSRICLPCRYIPASAKRRGSNCLKQCPKGYADLLIPASADIVYFRCVKPGDMFSAALLQPSGEKSAQGASSKTGSTAYVGGDPRNLKEGCSGPKRLTFAFVTDDNGKFLGYDRATIEKAVKKGLITREEADSMQISPLSKKVGPDGKYYYVDSKTGERAGGAR